MIKCIIIEGDVDFYVDFNEDETNSNDYSDHFSLESSDDDKIKMN